METGPVPETIRPTHGAGYYLLHRADLHTSLADAVREKDANAIILNYRLTGIHQIADDRVEISSPMVTSLSALR